MTLFMVIPMSALIAAVLTALAFMLIVLDFVIDGADGHVDCVAKLARAMKATRLLMIVTILVVIVKMTEFV